MTEYNILSGTIELEEVTAPPPVNNPPDVTGEGYTIDQDTPLVVTEAALLSNDTDLDGDALVITDALNPVNGTVSRAGGAVTFNPTAGFFGAASFDYVVSDGADTATGTVSVTVNEVVAPPPPTPVAGEGFQREQEFEVLDCRMTAGGILTFNICRRYWPKPGDPGDTATVNYTLSLGTVDTADLVVMDPLSGTLTFGVREIHKQVRIQTLAGAAGGVVNIALDTPSHGSIAVATAFGEALAGSITVFDGTASASDIRNAIEGASPGDAVLFQPGTSYGFGLMLEAAAGTAAAPICIGVNGVGSVRFSSLFIQWSNSHCRFEDIDFGGILILPSNGETPNGNHFYRSYIDDGNPGFYPVATDTRLICSVVDGAAGAEGCLADGDGLVMDYNHIFQTGTINGSDEMFAWAIYTSSHNSHIRWNLIDQRNGGTQGIKLRKGDNIHVIGNELIECHRVGLSGGNDSDAGHANPIYEYNYIHGCSIPFFIGEQSGGGGGLASSGIARFNCVRHEDFNLTSFAVGWGYPGGGSQIVGWVFHDNLTLLGNGCGALGIFEDLGGSTLRDNTVERIDAVVNFPVVWLSQPDLSGYSASDNTYPAAGDVYDVGGVRYASLADLQAAYPGAESGSQEV